MLPDIAGPSPVPETGCLPVPPDNIPLRPRSGPPEIFLSNRPRPRRTKPCNPAAATTPYNGWTLSSPGWLESTPPDPPPPLDKSPHPAAASRTASYSWPEYPWGVVDLQPAHSPPSTPPDDCDIPPSAPSAPVARPQSSARQPAPSTHPRRFSGPTKPAPRICIPESNSIREHAQYSSRQNSLRRYASNNTRCRVHPAPSASASPAPRSTQSKAHKTPRPGIPWPPPRARSPPHPSSAPRAPNKAPAPRESPPWNSRRPASDQKRSRQKQRRERPRAAEPT